MLPSAPTLVSRSAALARFAPSLHPRIAALILAAFTVGSLPTRAADPAPSNSSSLVDVSDRPPVNLDPMVVRAPKLPGFLGTVFGYSWNVSELTGGSNFHIRRGELVDAIGFRHLYLQKHPNEKAIVVVVTTPKDYRVTQAAAAYTVGSKLHLTSAALGDIQPSELSAADIDHPEVIRRFLQSLRDNDLSTFDTVTPIGGADQQAIDRSTGQPTLVTMGSLIAAAEETGDYSGITMFGLPMYKGSSQDMLISAFYWLNDADKVGLIPVARSTVEVTTSDPGARGGHKDHVVKVDAVIFDWDGMHYLYSDRAGTLGLPFPRNPLTGKPYLVIPHGDLMESVYFLAAYAQQHPNEATALVPAYDGVHAAAVFTRGGKLWMMSPFLGRFALPSRYKINQIEALEKLHQMLIAREMKKLPRTAVSRPLTGLPQTMPGDSANEEVRRAYLAFKDLGLPVKFVVNQRQDPGFEVSYDGAQYTYLAAGSAAGNGPNGAG